ESVRDGPGGPVDSADLLIGLLQDPALQDLLENEGVTVDRVRGAKRQASGYQLGQRFQALGGPEAKTRQVARIARLVAADILMAGRSVIEPEDILGILARDGLGWGIRIVEALGGDVLTILEQ